MRWRRGERSGDGIDARGSGGTGGGGRMPFPMPTTGLGRGGGCLSLVLVLAALAFGGQQLVSSGDGGGGGFGASVDGPLDSLRTAGGPDGSGVQRAPSDDKAFAFSSYVFDDVQRSWQERFGTSKPYRRAKLVVFSRVVNTGCGPASSATGPFYCPADERVASTRARTSRPGISTRRSPPPPPSATIASSRPPRAGSRPRPSPTARASSAGAGCAPASTQATRTAATPSAASCRTPRAR